MESSGIDGMVGDTVSHDTTKPNLFKMPTLAVKKKSGVIAKAFSDSDKDTSAINSFVSSDSKPTIEKETVSNTNERTQDAQIINCEEGNGKQNSKSKTFSPAEQLKKCEAIIPYKEPEWGGISDTTYSFEVVKNGIVVDRYELCNKSYHVFGRLPSCDHSMDHPSLSRYHTVIQHCILPSSDNDTNRRVGWYLYDLDSTHGTWINKNKVPSRTYLPLRVGYVVKFGGSSRLYILQGPDNDQDDESELTVAEMMAQKERQKKETEVIRQLEAMEAQEFELRKLKNQQDTGCMWGFGDDADAADSSGDDDNTVSAMPLHEELYIDDPKKALRGFFEREGWELPEYEFSDGAKGQHTCRVEIPIDTPSGEQIVSEVTQSGSRKDAVVACALQACRVLDRHGLLRKSTHESRAKKKKVPTATLR